VTANTYDLIVLGLGGMGSAAAYHLAARGKRVLGLERFGAAHDRGSSHGDSRIIRQAYHEHPNYVPLARSAYELWERLERESGASILRRTGGLMLGLPGSSVVEGTIRSATEYQLPFEVLGAEELRRRFPVLHPRPEELGVYEAAAGYVRPEAAIEAHLQLAARHGAELHFHEPVLRWTAHASGDGVVVETGVAQYEAGRLVVAPGAWAPEILADLEIPFDVRRHVMCWFQPMTEAARFQPEQFPIYVWDVDGRHCFYGLPATGGVGDGVKAAMHSGGEHCTAAGVDREIHDADIAEVRDCLQRFIPSLNGELLRTTTCMYTLTPDEHFVVAVHPRHSQVCVAVGFSGHGFKFTSVMGEILADLAIDGTTRHPIAFLSPKRFMPLLTEGMKL
jgi:sarcosine oxidase